MPNVIVRRPRTEQPQGPVPLRKELYENLLGYFPNSGNDLPTHPLTFAGNAAYGDTEFGRATLFDGTGDYTSAGDAFYSDEYTILVTFNANVLNADAKGVIIKRNLGTGTSTNEIWLYVTSTGVVFSAWQSGGAQILGLSASGSFVAGKTYTVGIDIPPGSGTAYMYINGALAASASKTGIIVDGAADLQFGALGSGVIQRYWNGYIGPAAFWRKRLPNTQELTANPWAIHEDEEFPVWFSAAGGAAALEGAAAATSTGTGTLATQIPIIGAAATVGTASGALSTSIPLLGAAVVTATASGDLSAQIKFNGSAIAQALAAGGITTGIPLVGAASGVAGASGSLDASASLAAAAQAIATAVGSLTTQITLSGAAISQAIASGELTAPGSGLSGAAAGQVSAAGSLTTGIPLIGAAQAYATGAGGLTTIIPLAGAAASVSAATGNLTVQITLTGAAIAQALAGGVLTTQVVLSGSAVSLASAAGVLTGGSAIVDSTWLVRPKVRRYSTRPAKRIYKGSR